jgi:hypothetical protein
MEQAIEYEIETSEEKERQREILYQCRGKEDQKVSQHRRDSEHIRCEKIKQEGHTPKLSNLARNYSEKRHEREKGGAGMKLSATCSRKQLQSFAHVLVGNN